MPRKREAPTEIPGLLHFSLNNDAEALTQAKRSRFEPKRRVEVRDVRAKGACFACRLMKKACSGARPCDRCVNMARSQRSSSYQRMLCVPSTFAPLKDFFNVDVYLHATPGESAERLLFRMSDIASQRIELDFEAYVKWNIEDISTDWARYITNKEHAPNTSAVGVLSSFQLQHLLSKCIPDVVCEQSRLLVYTSSLMYNLGANGHHEYTQPEFRQAISQVGKALVENLEKLLRQDDLDKAAPEQLRALFLILFGTILAVGYIGSCNDMFSTQMSYSREASQSSINEEIRQLQEESIQLLAYRMIDIACRLRLLDLSVSRVLLVELAQRKWHLPAAFTWAMIDIQTSTPSKEKVSKRALTPTRRALTPSQRAQAIDTRRRHSCARCFIRLDSAMCQSCMRQTLRQPANGLPLPQSLIISPEQPRVRDSPSSSFLGSPRCHCGFILPKDWKDDLCNVCMCQGIGRFDQDPDWLQLSMLSHPMEDPSFDSASMSARDMSFREDASSTMLNSIPVIPDSAASDFVVNYMEDVTIGGTLPALKSPPFLDNLGLDGGLPLRQTVPTCGHVADHARPIGEPLRYLV